MNAAKLLVLAAALVLGVAQADDAQKGEDVRFATQDGLSIAGTYYAPAEGTPLPAPVVIALPMYRQTRSSYAPIVRPVTDRGMALLTLDLRGHGDSAKQGEEDLSKRVADRDGALFDAMHADVEAAIAWLTKGKRAAKGKIGLLGASVGCSVAIDTAVRAPDDVAVVACLTPGMEYLGVPTMEHIAKWRKGKPLLLASSSEEANAGAGPIAARLDGKGAELRIVVPADSTAEGEAANLHGTNMFGRVADVEENVADWLAYHLAFRRVPLGDGVVAIVGSTGVALYVGVEVPAGSKATLPSLVVRVGLGPVTDPWSKTEIVNAGERLDRAAAGASAKARTRIGRERLGAAAGQSFVVALSLGGDKFHPEAGDPPLRFTLR